MPNPSPESGSFNTTNWSMVFSAGLRGSTQAQAALADLCSTYWFPLFTFARRSGHDPAQAEDLTQGFFETLIERDFLQDVDRSQGRFRSFLLAAFKHYIANQGRAARAQKRGGHLRLGSIDLAQAEGRYGREPYHDRTPEQVFEQQWALALLNHVLLLLRQEHEACGKGARYDTLRTFLSGGQDTTYRAAAAQLKMTEGAVKTAAHRLRKRFGELLRLEIARTVANPDDIEDELRGLFEILQRR